MASRELSPNADAATLASGLALPPLRPFWLSWWSDLEVDFELHSPWWTSGSRSLGDEDQPAICAAVMAADEDDALEQIKAAHDQRVALDWRFVQERPLGWSPFSDRFRRADWMQWPPTNAQTVSDGAGNGTASGSGAQSEVPGGHQ